MGQQIQVRNGYMRFWRLGPVEFGKQKRWEHRSPPHSRGLWAFPYPFFEMFLAYHKYADLLPKHLSRKAIEATPEDDRGELWQAQFDWVEKVGKRVLPIREFWYKGDVYSHFLPNGDIGNDGVMSGGETDWHSTDVTTLAKHIRSSNGNKMFLNYRGNLSAVSTGADHLEVFIAPNMGQFRNAKEFRKHK